MWIFLVIVLLSLLYIIQKKQYEKTEYRNIYEETDYIIKNDVFFIAEEVDKR